MKIQYHKVLLKKRFPLKISRGVKGDTYNVFVSVEKDGITGWGEAAPGKNENADTPEKVIEALQRLVATDLEGLSIYAIEQRARALNIPPCAYAGLDIALWDWTAKKAQLPLYQLLGFPNPLSLHRLRLESIHLKSLKNVFPYSLTEQQSNP